jgi:hypothetical protein
MQQHSTLEVAWYTSPLQRKEKLGVVVHTASFEK